MQIEKSIEINKTKKEVFDFLKFTTNQNQFSVWNMKDPSQKVTQKGVDGSIGFVYSWDSEDKSVGAGSQEIKGLTEGEKIQYELRFERPMKNVAFSQFLLKEIAPGKTQVTWDFKGPTKFPMSLFTPIFKNMLGKDMSKSLDNLKNKLESNR